MSTDAPASYVCGMHQQNLFHGASLVEQSELCKRSLRFFLFVWLDRLDSIVSSAKYSSPRERPDVSNKASHQQKTAPPITTESKASAADSAALHKLADDYYSWRNQKYPVAAAIPACTPGTIG